MARSINNTCSVLYGPAVGNCTLSNYANAKAFEDDTAKIELDSIQANITYCFMVTVTSSGNIFAIIEGTFLSNKISGMGVCATFLL